MVKNLHVAVHERHMISEVSVTCCRVILLQAQLKERSSSMARRVKTWLQSNIMNQKRFNHVVILARTDKIPLVDVAKEFAQ